MHCHIASFCLHQGPGVFLGTFRGFPTHPRSFPWKTGQIWPNEVCKLHLTIALDYHSEVENDMNSTWFHDWLHLIPFLAQPPFSCIFLSPFSPDCGLRNRDAHILAASNTSTWRMMITNRPRDYLEPIASASENCIFNVATEHKTDSLPVTAWFDANFTCATSIKNRSWQAAFE